MKKTPIFVHPGDVARQGGDGINEESLKNRIIEIALRAEDNLIILDDNNELYTDLQLEDGLSTSDELPVGVTTGRVLQADGWVETGTMLAFKTTSGDYVTWIYGDDGKLYVDNGTGTFKQVYIKAEVDALLQQLRQELSELAFSGDYNDLINKPTLGTASALDVGSNPGNIPVVKGNGMLDPNIIPTVISDVYTVTNASDLTTLSNAVKGDYGIVTSESKTYILSQDPYSVQANWVEMLSPSSSVTSVNGQTGAVNLTTSNVSVGDTSHQYVTSNEKNTWNNKLGTNNVATVAISGNYNDLNNKPTITGATYVTQAQYDALPSSKNTDGNSYFIFTS